MLAFAVSVIATYVVRGYAKKRGIVSVPREDRWNRKSIALMGGVAIYITMVFNWLLAGMGGGHILIVATTSILFFAGLVDDFANLKPYQKLAAQLVASSLFVASGLVLPWTPFVWLNTAITIVWLIGITNAVNLLDNMDGLAAGISAIAGCFLARLFYETGQSQEAVLMLSFAAAVAGFLVFNWNPATIFMGDCGSMLLGFFLGGMSLLYVAGGRFHSFVPVIAVPVLVLLIPIFDTAFVSLLRKFHGRPISIGGQDHTSHRLVRLGIPEKQAVLVFYACATISGIVGVFVARLPVEVSVALLLAFASGVVILGAYIAQVKVYSDEEIEAAREQPVLGFLINVSHRRPVFELVLDLAIATTAFQVATLYHYGERVFLARPLLIAIAIKLSVFLATGMYRDIWRFASISCALTALRAVSISYVMLATVALSFLPGLSQTMLVFDACICFLLLVLSRISFRSLRQVVRTINLQHGEPALIFGADDRGEMLLRELHQNPDHSLAPIGFVDDNPVNWGRSIHGVRIHGGNGSLPSIIEKTGAKHLVMATNNVEVHRYHELKRACQETGVSLKRMRFSLNADDTPPSHHGTTARVASSPAASPSSS